MKHVLRTTGVFLVCLGSLNAMSQPASILDEPDVALVQRILQYEFVLGSELKPKIALCLDEAMGSSWFLEADSTLEIRQSVVEKLRRTVETCTVATSSEGSRLAAQLRAMTEGMLKKAQQLEIPISSARVCISKEISPAEFRNCITKALGKPPAEVDWGYWMILFERSTSS